MKIAVVGLGLIGGSFYKAALRAGHEAVGLHHHDSGAALGEAEVVFVCLPPEAIVPWIREHAASFRAGAIVVDICGVKRPIMREMSALPRENYIFVGGHPMAGREVSGFENSLASLFDGASMILTPWADTPAEAIRRLKDLFRDLGFHDTVVTTPEKHDEMIAFTSQLCHVIATGYARDPRVVEAAGYSAGSYANMTRIATQDAAVWRSLYLANRDGLVPVLDGFIERLREFRDAVAQNDGSRIERMIEEGTRAKRQDLLNRRRGDENV